jgi:cytochrome P450
MPNALLGSMLDLKRDFLGTLEQAMLDQGEYARVVYGPPGVRRVLHVITSPDGIQHVLATNSRNYVKRNPFYEEVQAWLGDGVLTSEGDTWQRQRRIVQPLFTPRRVATYVDVMAEEASRVVEEMRPQLAPTRTVDLHGMSMRLTLRIVGRLLFGDDVDDVYETLDRAFPVINEVVVTRGQQPVRLPRQWPTPLMRRAMGAQRDLFEVVDRLVARHRDPDGSPDLVTLLQHARDPETGGQLNNREIRDQVLIFLLAGHETTAIALTFALHLLGHHEAVQDRVRTEVNRVVTSWPPSADDLQRLTSTWAVVQEAMRLYPPAPNTGRLATGPDTVLNHRIDAGAIVVICIWALHRNPALWPDPQRFDPARFSPDAVAGRHRYAYVPFGGGPRACLGALFARLEATVAMAALVRAYRLRTDPVQPAVTTGITLHPCEPVPCTVSVLAAADR